jgi:hypothetical protein
MYLQHCSSAGTILLSDGNTESQLSTDGSCCCAASVQELRNCALELVATWRSDEAALKANAAAPAKLERHAADCYHSNNSLAGIPNVMSCRLGLHMACCSLNTHWFGVIQYGEQVQAANYHQKSLPCRISFNLSL